MSSSIHQPLNVFAVDVDGNRCTGALPYTSLSWQRRYYECGKFTLVVPADIYDSSWRMIECYERPETGIIQKRELSDTDHTREGSDTVTLSGFFLESIVNRHTFLDETPTETTERYYVAPPPTPVYRSLAKPKIYKGSDGMYWYSTGSGTSYGVMDGTASDSPNRKPGGEILDFGAGGAKVETGSGTVLLTPVNFEQDDNTYYYKDQQSSTTMVTVKNNGKEETHDICFDDGKGSTYYWDDSGTLHRAVGVNKKQLDANKKAKYSVETKEYSGPPYGWRTKTIYTLGPWQTTEATDPVTEQDNIALCVKWVRQYFQNGLLYEDNSDIVGVKKKLDPSFELLGDLLYQELQTVEASFRVQYLFEQNQFIFSVWRGLDRTFDTNAPKTEATAAIAVKSTRASALPAGYTLLEYIESTGTQYIDTGFKPNSNTRTVLDISSDATIDESQLFGCRTSTNSNDCYDVLMAGDTGRWRDDYGSDKIDMSGSPKSGRIHIDKNKNTTSIGGYTSAHAASSFTVSYTMHLFSINTGGKPSDKKMKAKMYGAEIYDNGTQVRGFVPAKRDSDSAVGFYDTVNGVFYGNSGTGTFNAGPAVQIPDQLEYQANDNDATGSTGPTSGYQGQAVSVAKCGFEVAGKAFASWNTMPDGSANTYKPGDKFLLTEGNDVLYAQWDDEQVDPEPVPGNPWVVFSDLYGNLYDFSASVDDSNYRNVCFVLYEYEEPSAWCRNGMPDVVFTFTPPQQGGGTEEGGAGTGVAGAPSEVTVHLKDYLDNEDGVTMVDLVEAIIALGVTSIQWEIPTSTKRGTVRAAIDDGDDYDDRETYLDVRGDAPSFAPEMSGSVDIGSPWADYGLPSLSTSLKAQYEGYEDNLREQGTTKLTTDYPIVTNIDTGTLSTLRYIEDYDLGDKVDVAISKIGVTETARIVGVDETYESSGNGVKYNVSVTIGNEKITSAQKARLI